MAGVSQLNELEAKKQALAAEAEVYRQSLKLELQNLRLYTARTRRSFRMLSPSNPMMVLGATLAGSWFRRRRFGRFRLLTMALLGWQFYQKVLAPLGGLFSRRRRPSGTRVRRPEEKSPAANI